MLISLSEIMNIPGGSRTFEADYSPETFSTGGNTYTFLEKKPVSVTVRNDKGRRVHVSAHGAFKFSVPCDRCRVPQEVPVEIDFSQEIDMNKTSKERAEELDDTEYITGYDLDVDRLVYEEILLGFPMKVLCSEDCKGTCIVCGHNLNLGECGCDRTEPDPRMAVIRDIFKKTKEV